MGVGLGVGVGVSVRAVWCGMSGPNLVVHRMDHRHGPRTAYDLAVQAKRQHPLAVEGERGRGRGVGEGGGCDRVGTKHCQSDRRVSPR